MRTVLAAPATIAMPGVRTFALSDEPALGSLMYRAYLGTLDYEGETPAQAAAEVRKVIEGQYGVTVRPTPS